ncbi:sulfate respiration complex protein HmcD [Pseudodesulfovibrio sp.]
MEFFTLQDYYTHTKSIVYLIMGGILVAATLYWRFLMGGNHKDD